MQGVSIVDVKHSYGKVKEQGDVQRDVCQTRLSVPAVMARPQRNNHRITESHA